LKWLEWFAGRKDQEPNLSLAEVHGTVHVRAEQSLLRRIFAISGPAFLVSVGYMDPGNWATDLAAGATYNYALLWVLLMSNLMAVLLQSLAARLGVVRGLDLAQACRAEYGRGVNFALYVLCEVAITACDLAEVLGSAIAIQLLFGLPLMWGVVLSAADVIALLFLSSLGIRKLEAVILSLISVMGLAFFVEIFFAKPEWGGVFSGFVPSLPDAGALFVTIGILGATVMPHNLYLHSSLVQTRRIGEGAAQKRQFIRWNTLDSCVALNMAFLVNAAILIMAAAVFYRSGHREVAEIQDAYRLLQPILGVAIAPVAFAVALLASGQSSTITGTLAGQIVMEGFLSIRIPPWVRRLITRLMAIAPAIIVIGIFGERGTGQLLILSQVVLSLQLPFAIVPMVHFVSDREKMGEFAIGPVLKTLAWATAAVVIALNAKLTWDTIRIWMVRAGSGGGWIGALALVFAAAVGILLGYIILRPWLPKMFFLRKAPSEAGVHAPAKPALALSREERPEPYGRVAVALDFSGRDSEVIAETLRFLGPQKPHLALMHVVESATARFLGGDSGDVESLGDARRLEAYAEQIRPLGYEVSTFLGRGKPVAELTRMIGEFAPDLVVLGAHGHRFLSDLIFGSTADSLRHRIGASVLVVAKRGR
jgi:manganese transport protein